MQDLDPRVKTMYQGVAQVLKHYRSGKLPKAFKLIPSLTNWEQILYFTGKGFFDHVKTKFTRVYRRPREMERSSNVCSHSHLHVKPDRENGPKILQPRAVATRPR